MRISLVVVFLLTSLSGIIYIFWNDDVRYSLPTPVPEGYQSVPAGVYIDLTDRLPVEDARPVHLHFFDPECPCSRFNIPHFRSLVRQYGDLVQFVVVVLDKKKKHDAGTIADVLDVDVAISFDASIAALCGVYSTPQALVLDDGHRMYYRGNYNRTRYCSDKRTNYAQHALDSLLAGHTRVHPSLAALKSYGCRMPYSCVASEDR